MADMIQIRRDTAANWSSANPVLAQGEIGAETDTNKIKMGDGLTAWDGLDYLIDTGNYITTETIIAVEKGGTGAADATTARSNLGLGNVDDVSAADLRDRTTHTGEQPISSVTGLQGELDGKANLVGGKVPVSELPAITVSSTHVVADLTARDALTVEEGDVAIVQDTGAGEPASFIYDGTQWQELLTPVDGVTNVSASGSLDSTGGTTPEITLKDSGVTETKIADGAVTNAKLAGSIDPAKVAGTAVVDNDSRLSDQREPTDSSVTDAKIDAAGLSPTSITGTAVVDSDARLSDERTPLDGSVTTAKIDAAGIDPTAVTGTAVVDADSRLAEGNAVDQTVRSLGTGPTQALPGDYDVAGQAPVQSVAAKTGDVTLVKADVGLSNVDNVSSADLRDRSTHTGTQTLSTISDAGDLAGEADAPTDGSQYARQNGAWSEVVIPPVPVGSVNTQTGDVVLDAADVGAVPTTRTVTGANGLTGGGALSSNQVISHADTSSQASVNNSGTTVIQDVTLDTYGHVTGLGSTTLSIPAAANNATITISGGSGLSGSAAFTTNQSFNETITLSHADTSSQGSVNNNGTTFIQDITLDTYGHITGIGSATVSVTPPTTLGAVGTYGFFVARNYVTGGGIYTPAGGTISGSYLFWVSWVYDEPTGGLYYAIDEDTASPSGTWRCMGYVNTGSQWTFPGTVFVRIS